MHISIAGQQQGRSGSALTGKACLIKKQEAEIGPCSGCEISNEFSLTITLSPPIPLTCRESAGEFWSVPDTYHDTAAIKVKSIYNLRDTASGSTESESRRRSTYPNR